MNNIYNDLVFSPVCAHAYIDNSHSEISYISRDSSEEIYALRSDFERLREDMYLVLLKLQECSKRDNLVDDEGGALDDFIAGFIRK